MDPAWILAGEPYSRQKKFGSDYSSCGWPLFWGKPRLNPRTEQDQALGNFRFGHCTVSQNPSERMLSFAWVPPFLSRKISQHLNARYKLNQKKHRQRDPASVARETSSVKAEFTICNNEVINSLWKGSDRGSPELLWLLASSQHTKC